MVIDREHESGNAIQVYLREIGRTPLLTPQEETELAVRVKRGDKRARARMIKANLRLVVKISHDYENLGLPLLDLISEGNIGLMKAVERFDPKKGAKLSTYAAWWIKQSIRRALSNQSKTIRLPVHVVDKMQKMNRVSLKLFQRLGREPTDAELADLLDLTPAKVAHLRTVAVRPASLDAAIGDDDGTRFSDIIEDTEAMTPFELLKAKTMRQEIRQQLRHLSPREAEILTLRYGLNGQEPQTLDVVGTKFKITRERVRQIQEIALTKLRRLVEKQDGPALIHQS
jgi:RNA polymerase primary sigma factor